MIYFYLACLLGLMGIYLLLKGIRYTGSQRAGDIRAGIVLLVIGGVIVFVTYHH